MRHKQFSNAAHLIQTAILWALSDRNTLLDAYAVRPWETVAPDNQATIDDIKADIAELSAYYRQRFGENPS